MSDSLESRSESPDGESALEELLHFVPPPLRRGPDSDVPVPEWSPVTFYDKHLDDSLILKRVKVLLCLISSLSETLDDHLLSFKSRSKSFYYPYIAVRRDPYLISLDGFAKECSSSFKLHLLAEHPPDFHSEQYSLQHTLQRGTLMSIVLEALDDDRKALLLSARKSLPRLAVYEAYTLSGKTILEDMSGLSNRSVFPWSQGDSDASKYLWKTEPSDDSVWMQAPPAFVVASC
ncbi:hypothetical protein IW261DRAFT_1612169 [Armillaria novae-zelandiae]|uniref:Uncharacterized protein n=1 Tax=Armillaria novae-zelandiae TaxID=153914 RepID=A0AA39NT13_9AGAR|nr:hypothetical protein IW261DRAFT_1612169 [Armillaria novae-zelandiae]